MKKLLSRKQFAKYQTIHAISRGFSLNETLIALAAGTLVIGGGAVALQSMQTLANMKKEQSLDMLVNYRKH